MQFEDGSVDPRVWPVNMKLQDTLRPLSNKEENKSEEWLESYRCYQHHQVADTVLWSVARQGTSTNLGRKRWHHNGKKSGAEGFTYHHMLVLSMCVTLSTLTDHACILTSNGTEQLNTCRHTHTHHRVGCVWVPLNNLTCTGKLHGHQPHS